MSLFPDELFEIAFELCRSAALRAASGDCREAALLVLEAGNLLAERAIVSAEPERQDWA